MSRLRSPRRNRTPFKGKAEGIPTRLALDLEEVAKVLYPDDVERILRAREDFERGACHLVVQGLDRLSFTYAEALVIAKVTEALGLTRSAETPDPFRRVKLNPEEGSGFPGVVMPGHEGEVSVFCPPKGRYPMGVGDAIDLSYEEQDTPCTYRLQVKDTVALPGARVFHLGPRLGKEASHARTSRRHAVEIIGFLRQLSPDGTPSGPLPCRMTDISSGGTRLSCGTRIEPGTHVLLDIFLDDGITEPLSAKSEVRWAEGVPEGHELGVQFEELDPERSKRLEQALLQLQGPKDLR